MNTEPIPVGLFYDDRIGYGPMAGPQQQKKTARQKPRGSWVMIQGTTQMYQNSSWAVRYCSLNEDSTRKGQEIMESGLATTAETLAVEIVCGGEVQR